MLVIIIIIVGILLSCRWCVREQINERAVPFYRYLAYARHQQSKPEIEVTYGRPEQLIVQVSINHMVFVVVKIKQLNK